MVGALEERRDLQVRPHGRPRGRLLDRHAAADRERQPARRPCLLLHAHRPDRALPADDTARASSTRWAGTTTACRPSAASRTTSASGATRPCRTTRTSRRRRSRTPKKQIPISRPNFIELCEQLVEEDEKVFESLWRTLGLSVDWSENYTTIGSKAQRVSQTAFLRNYARGEAYLQEAPTLWDVTFQTAVAQAELEARDYPGAYHRVAFHQPDGEPLHIETTRPELIPSVVALIAHPDDERYQALFGTTVTSPVFGVEIPVLAHPAAEPDKGAGIAMCCTFGDLTDVMWWRELNLPVRTVIGRDGRILRETPEWLSSEGAAAAYEELKGKTTFSAREAVVAAAARVGRPRRRAQGDPADGELLREGRQAARDRRHPPVVHPQRRPRRRAAGRDAGARRRDHLGPRPHEAPLRQLGRRPQRRLADLPPAVLRHPVPGLVPPRRRRRPRLRPPAAAQRGRSCRSTRRRRHPRASTSPSAASPAASWATPT